MTWSPSTADHPDPREPDAQSRLEACDLVKPYGSVGAAGSTTYIPLGEGRHSDRVPRHAKIGQIPVGGSAVTLAPPAAVTPDLLPAVNSSWEDPAPGAARRLSMLDKTRIHQVAADQVATTEASLDDLVGATTGAPSLAARSTRRPTTSTAHRAYRS